MGWPSSVATAGLGLRFSVFWAADAVAKKPETHNRRAKLKRNISGRSIPSHSRSGNPPKESYCRAATSRKPRSADGQSRLRDVTRLDAQLPETGFAALGC